MTRAAIYNRFWSTMGGGERYSAAIGRVLSRSGAEVDLIGHEQVDLAELGSRLAVDLSNVNLRVIPHANYAVEAVSSEYDLWVTATHTSRSRSRAHRSVYVCWFPQPDDPDQTQLRRAAIRCLGPYLRRPAGNRPWRLTDGWLPRESAPTKSWLSWTSGDAGLEVEPGDELVLEALLWRPSLPETDLVLSHADGTEVQRIKVAQCSKPARIVVPASKEMLSLRLVSDASSRKGDSRMFGVVVEGLRTAGRMTLRERLMRWLKLDPAGVGFLDSYDMVLAISEFTRDWMRRLWGVSPEILYPPIDVREFVAPIDQREPVIVSLGRFFPPEVGHSKRQLEMVHSFRKLVADGRMPDWRLVLIGGCQDAHLPYLHQVMAAAEGLAVEIHANAPRALVRSTLSTASIFWSATGIGVSEARRPWATEHFGMSTVEAMAAGCVPVVIDRSGQREIVRDGVDGFCWANERQWRARTLQVATQAELRVRLSASAVARADEFSDLSFEKRWHELASEHDLIRDSPEQP